MRTDDYFALSLFVRYNRSVTNLPAIRKLLAAKLLHRSSLFRYLLVTLVMDILQLRNVPTYSWNIQPYERNARTPRRSSISPR